MPSCVPASRVHGRCVFRVHNAETQREHWHVSPIAHRPAPQRFGISEADAAEAYYRFNRADQDGSGNLSSDEILEVLRVVMAGQMKDSLLVRLASTYFNAADRDRSGSISADEFYQIYSEIRKACKNPAPAAPPTVATVAPAPAVVAAPAPAAVAAPAPFSPAPLSPAPAIASPATPATPAALSSAAALFESSPAVAPAAAPAKSADLFGEWADWGAPTQPTSAPTTPLKGASASPFDDLAFLTSGSSPAPAAQASPAPGAAAVLFDLPLDAAAPAVATPGALPPPPVSAADTSLLDDFLGSPAPSAGAAPAAKPPAVTGDDFETW